MHDVADDGAAGGEASESYLQLRNELNIAGVLLFQIRGLREARAVQQSSSRRTRLPADTRSAAPPAPSAAPDPGPHTRAHADTHRNAQHIQTSTCTRAENALSLREPCVPRRAQPKARLAERRAGARHVASRLFGSCLWGRSVAGVRARVNSLSVVFPSPHGRTRDDCAGCCRCMERALWVIARACVSLSAADGSTRMFAPISERTRTHTAGATATALSYPASRRPQRAPRDLRTARSSNWRHEHRTRAASRCWARPCRPRLGRCR